MLFLPLKKTMLDFGKDPENRFVRLYNFHPFFSTLYKEFIDGVADPNSMGIL